MSLGRPSRPAIRLHQIGNVRGAFPKRWQGDSMHSHAVGVGGRPGIGLRIDRGEQADHVRPRLTGIVDPFEETGEGERGASIEHLEMSQDQRRRGLEAALHTSKPHSGAVNGCQGGVEDVGLAPLAGELVHGAGELELARPCLADQQHRFVSSCGAVHEFQAVQPRSARSADELAKPTDTAPLRHRRRVGGCRRNRSWAELTDGAKYFATVEQGTERGMDLDPCRRSNGTLRRPARRDRRGCVLPQGGVLDALE